MTGNPAAAAAAAVAEPPFGLGEEKMETGELSPERGRRDGAAGDDDVCIGAGRLGVVVVVVALTGVTLVRFTTLLRLRLFHVGDEPGPAAALAAAAAGEAVRRRAETGTGDDATTDNAETGIGRVGAAAAAVINGQVDGGGKCEAAGDSYMRIEMGVTSFFGMRRRSG